MKQYGLIKEVVIQKKVDKALMINLKVMAFAIVRKMIQKKAIKVVKVLGKNKLGTVQEGIKRLRKCRKFKKFRKCKKY